MNAAHRLLITLTRGKVGYSAAGMPVVELTTTGRRTGEPRTVLLTAPLHGDGRYVVVASRGGDDRHPAWFLNLRANPDVRVAVQGGPAVPMRARVADPQERARLWPQIAGRYRNYAGYQRSTTREIPLVHLEPA
ncbi:nitroreductase family deazaflavin-dependent oxidoreductase [Pseudonocardia sp. C8]|uniref:nitroreductase/quinone reductase family protein n=1 Tax=Pseudonocardia sp. C8 TaxID=2762759 RepID=UPI001642ACB0|nr:nitroreductase/quinone reductase family protein [Pseudonocardia sp. C8]MBC3193262.1 nitroreductase family deazaflavin-dependent oxidoreductase [Pseudonocardia sp. C8]